MPTLAWFIPGFMGSTLGLYPPTVGGKVSGPKILSLWGNLQAIPNLPLLPVLALPGTLPANTQILADGLAPTALGGYTDFLNNLQRILPTGWTLSPYPYDWRQSCKTTGLALASALTFAQGQGNTNVVIAHSLGALVAWMAWAALVDQANTAAMSRLITFGGALYGTSSTPGIFLENESALAQLPILQNIVSGRLPNAFANLISGPTDAQVQALLQTAASWPSVYDLYPDAAAQDDPGDTNRPLTFSVSAWTRALAQPNFTLMNTEANQVHAYLRVAKYLPPLTQVVNIVGAGWNTPYRVQPSQSSAGGPNGTPPPASLQGQATLTRRWFLPSWSNTINGDGRATINQQSWPFARLVLVQSQHAAQQDDPAVLMAVAAYLQGPITPPTPVISTSQPVANPPLPLSQDKLTLAQQLLAAAANPPTIPAWANTFGIVVPQPNLAPARPVIPVRTGVDP